MGEAIQTSSAAFQNLVTLAQSTDEVVGRVCQIALFMDYENDVQAQNACEANLKELCTVNSELLQIESARYVEFMREALSSIILDSAEDDFLQKRISEAFDRAELPEMACGVEMLLAGSALSLVILALRVERITGKDVRFRALSSHELDALIRVGKSFLRID